MRVKVSRRAAVMGVGSILLGFLSGLRAVGGEGTPWETVGAVGVITAAALLHELGHAAVAWGCGIPVRSLRLDLFGARMELGGVLSYGRELAVAAGGPLVNLLSAALAYPLCALYGFEGGMGLFFIASLCLGGLNLLPVQSLDGGRILGCALSLLLGAEAGERAVALTTGLFLGGLWLLSVYALLRVGQMLTLFSFTLCLLLRLLIPETGQK